MHSKRFWQAACLVCVVALLTGCAARTPAVSTLPQPTSTAAATSLPSISLTPRSTATTAAAPVLPTQTTVVDPDLEQKYELIDLTVCQNIQQMASEALGVDFSLESPVPFLDQIAAEAGQGCRLSAQGDGNKFANPQSAVQALVASAGLGWTEQPTYQADGPTGSTTALARDMGLMIIKVDWSPAAGVVCPADQPIADCNLTPQQKIYSLQIDIAQYRANFSLDGHWEDTAAGFSLDLFQDWKNIYGHHTTVAQDGKKIDTLDVSINGSLQGQVATVQFNSSFTDSVGTAQITYVDVNTIIWKITTPPTGEYYLPAQATLTR